MAFVFLYLFPVPLLVFSTCSFVISALCAFYAVKRETEKWLVLMLLTPIQCFLHQIGVGLLLVPSMYFAQNMWAK